MAIELDNLASPADADNFRMTVDWGRWYIDPLPSDDIAPATEDKWPSISAVKKASEKDWSFLVNPRNAQLPAAELHRIADLDPTQRLDAFSSHEKIAKQTSFGRGTIIHLWAEDLLAGRAPREITDEWLSANKYPAAALVEAKLYLPALVDFFDAYQPEPVAVEYVTIHRDLNGCGYGGTPDALVRIEGEIVGIDWKTRNGDKPAAYAEELAQIAAGARAQYMVVNDGGQSRRQLLPDISGGYVVSIHTNGARLYPLDIDKGWQHWCNLHEWWVARRTEKDGIKRVLPFKRGTKTAPQAQPAPTEPAPAVYDKQALIDRFNALKAADPEFEERFKMLEIPKTDYAAVDAALRVFEKPKTTLERANERMAEAPAKPQHPDHGEGGPATEDDEGVMRAFAEFMTPEQRSWVGAITSAPCKVGRGIRYSYAKTKRRADICIGLANLAGSGYWDDIDDAVRVVLYVVTDTDVALQDGLSIPDALAQFDTAQAAEFRAAVRKVTEDPDLYQVLRKQLLAA